MKAEDPYASMEKDQLISMIHFLVKREVLTELNSNNTKLLTIEETKEKIASLQYIQNELNGIPNLV